MSDPVEQGEQVDVEGTVPSQWYLDAKIERDALRERVRFLEQREKERSETDVAQETLIQMQRATNEELRQRVKGLRAAMAMGLTLHEEGADLEAWDEIGAALATTQASGEEDDPDPGPIGIETVL